MINFVLNIDKLVQVTNYLLKLNTYRLNYTKLIKLLYLADRTFLEKWDTTITKDKYCSMKNGPVLSKLYELITNNNKKYQKYWNQFFTTENYDLISLVKDNLQDNELNEIEEETIKEIDKKFKNYSWQDMIDYVDNKYSINCPEWENPGNTSVPLAVEKILKKLGRNDTEIQEITNEEKSYRIEKRILVRG